MIVCHCRALTDRDIRRAIVDGARTATDVAEACGAGMDCGCCREGVEELLITTICVRRRAHSAVPVGVPSAPAPVAVPV